MEIEHEEYLNLTFSHKYARIIFNKYHLKLKDKIFTKLEINPLFNYNPSVYDLKYLEIREKFKNLIKDENFKKDYSKLIDILIYENTSIFLKFNFEKYCELLNLDKAFNDNTFLVIPFAFIMTIECISLKDEKKEGTLKITYNQYDENLKTALIASESESKIFKLDPDYITLLTRVIMFKKPEEPDIQSYNEFI